MTITGQKTVFLANFIISVLIALFSLGATLYIFIKLLPLALPQFDNPFVYLKNQPYHVEALLISITVFPLFSAYLNGYIFFLFRKTYALEVSFFSTFMCLLSFESLRLLFPLFELWNKSASFAIGISRLVLFFRIFALFLLLASGIFSFKNITRRPVTVGFLLFFLAFLLAGYTPMNTAHITPYFFIASGFAKSFLLLLLLFSILTVCSVLIAGRLQSAYEYFLAAIGLTGFLVCYIILLYTTSWVLLIFPAFGFVAGGIYFVKKMHQFYLWM